jgi:septum formation inhibitor MinC
VLNCRKELETLIRSTGLNCVMYDEAETKAKFSNELTNKIKNTSSNFDPPSRTYIKEETNEKQKELSNDTPSTSLSSTTSSSMFHNSTVRSGQQVYAESKSLTIIG